MKSITGEQRRQVIEDIMEQHVGGRETLGTAIRRLRLEVTGLDQETFAVMCGMSTRALYLIETDKGNPTLSTLDSILRKFGLRLGLMSTSKTQGMKPASTVRHDLDSVKGLASRASQRPFKRVVVRGSKPRVAAGEKVILSTSKLERKKAKTKSMDEQA